MGKKSNSGVAWKGGVIFVVTAFFWYNVLPMFFSAMKGETVAMFALFLGLLTVVVIGDNFLKWI